MKSKNTLILTDSMLKTLRMCEFNQFLQEGKAYLFLEQKQNSLTITLAQHQYDFAIIHFGIIDLLHGSSIEQISKDGIEIAQRCRNRSIGKIFISGIVYCPKVRHKTIQSLNKSLCEECIKYGFVWLIMEQFQRKIYGRLECI